LYPPAAGATAPVADRPADAQGSPSVEGARETAPGGSIGEDRADRNGASGRPAAGRGVPARMGTGPPAADLV